MQDYDIQAARERLAQEDADGAIELYERLRGGKHGTEADLAVALCKFYKAKQAGSEDEIEPCYDWLLHYLKIFFDGKDIDSVDTQFALAFPPLLVKAWNIDMHLNPYEDFISHRSAPEGVGSFMSGLFGENSEDEGKAGQVRRLLFAKPREAFLCALATDEFARLNDRRKHSLLEAAAELDKYFLEGRSYDVKRLCFKGDQNVEQMNGIYYLLGREDPRDIKKHGEIKLKEEVKRTFRLRYDAIEYNTGCLVAAGAAVIIYLLYLFGREYWIEYKNNNVFQGCDIKFYIDVLAAIL